MIIVRVAILEIGLTERIKRKVVLDRSSGTADSLKKLVFFGSLPGLYGRICKGM